MGVLEGIFDDLGACLYLVQIFLGFSVAKITLFWICGSVVMMYMYSLLMYY